MSHAVLVRFEPRKTPLQARSTETVSAILQATVQVLLKDGKSKLTTTRIAERAGVSVGTLYQYFPNKTSLLQTLLREHLDGTALALEIACAAAHGAPLRKMAEAIVTAFVEAKCRDLDASAALYSVSDDVEGKRLARSLHARAPKAMAAMFATARKKVIKQPEMVAATLFGAMTGVSRAMLDREVTRSTKAAMQEQLTVLARAYLEASAERA